jgi:group I intron endonuclease
MIGYIYKITNNINGKVYIGQTRNNPKIRWQQHCRLNLPKDGYELQMVIKKALIKYGKENFTFEVIEECEVENLNDREIYWISYYDSYYKGYNSTFGGGGTAHDLKIDESEWKNVKNLYLDEYLSLRKIADIYNVDKATIKHVLVMQGITTRPKTYKHKEEFLIELLTSGKSLRSIEKEYGISRGYLSTFKKKHRI